MKIKEDQLKKIQEQQAAVTKILNEVGYLEANKHGLLHELAGVNQDIEDFKGELEKVLEQIIKMKLCITP